jgi:hypothetical protein
LGDLDGDGDLDAVVATAKGASIWKNQGVTQGGQTGIFTESEQRLGRGQIEAVFLADLDANGDLDALWRWGILMGMGIKTFLLVCKTTAYGSG